MNKKFVFKVQCILILMTIFPKYIIIHLSFNTEFFAINLSTVNIFNRMKNEGDSEH